MNVIVLTREDVYSSYKDIPAKRLSTESFKLSSLSIPDLQKSDVVMFCEDNVISLLKLKRADTVIVSHIPLTFIQRP